MELISTLPCSNPIHLIYQAMKQTVQFVLFVFFFWYPGAVELSPWSLILLVI